MDETKPYLLAMTESILAVVVVVLLFYAIFNASLYLVCLSSEGTPYWNKMVTACHFNDTMTSTQISQTIITQDSLCFRNGIKINCSVIE